MEAEVATNGSLAAVYFAAAAATGSGKTESWEAYRTASRALWSGGGTRRLAMTLEVLASDTRLDLLRMLWGGERTLEELSEDMMVRPASLRRHVQRLVELRWIAHVERNRLVITPDGRRTLVTAWALVEAICP